MMHERRTIKIMLEDFWRPAVMPYIKWNSLYKLLSKYYEIELSNNPDFLLYSSFGYEHLKYKCLRIFYTGENVRPNFEECDYAFSFDYPITERNYRLPIYRLYPSYQKLLEPRSSKEILGHDRKFCCFLASNSQGKVRNKFFELLSSYKKIDAGGKLFFNVEEPVPRGKEIEWMSQYKFCLAFENSSYPGYTTEKLTPWLQERSRSTGATQLWKGISIPAPSSIAMSSPVLKKWLIMSSKRIRIPNCSESSSMNQSCRAIKSKVSVMKKTSFRNLIRYFHPKRPTFLWRKKTFRCLPIHSSRLRKCC